LKGRKTEAPEHFAACNSDEAHARTIPQPFPDAILEVFTKSIEQALADVMTG
jgi:hypothetical protein